MAAAPPDGAAAVLATAGCPCVVVVLVAGVVETLLAGTAFAGVVEVGGVDAGVGPLVGGGVGEPLGGAGPDGEGRGGPG